MAQNKVRDSKYELIRILGAITITLSHVPCFESALKINKLIHNFNIILGGFGVNIFVILGAWFLSRDRFKPERIIRIIGQMVFYGILLDVFSFLLGSKFEIKTALSGFVYWFPFGYVAMLIATPFIERLSSKTNQIIILIGGSIASIVTTMGFVWPDFVLIKLFSKGLFIGPVWFIFIMICMIELHNFIEKREIKNVSIYLIIFFALFISMYAIFSISHIYTIREMYSPLCFLSALCLFIYMAFLPIKYNQFINSIAAAAFGIYLMQTHRVFRQYVWGIIDFSALSETSIYYPFICIIELLGIGLVGFTIDKYWNYIWIRISNSKIYVKLVSKI